MDSNIMESNMTSVDFEYSYSLGEYKLPVWLLIIQMQVPSQTGQSFEVCVSEDPRRATSKSGTVLIFWF